MITTAFTAADPEILSALQALADGNRLRIVEVLRRGERCVCEIQEAVGLSQSLLSHHLRALREAGLVRDRREGRWVHYALDPRTATALETFIRGLARDAETASRSDGPGCAT